MNIAKSLIAATALVAITAGAALAADDDKKFDGAYVGVEAGIDWTKLTSGASRDKSLYYGGVLGFRKQMDSGLVFGIEGSFGDTGYQNNSTNADYEWSTGLILGSAFGSDGANLIYGKAAYVQTRFTDIGDLGTASKFSDGGWRFGAGYERALSSKISLRLGGDYTTYGHGANGWASKAGLLVKF